MKTSLHTLIVAVFLTACNTRLEPINYGKDQCAACRMTIMDKKFGAELVSSKGKIIKFDSGECMLAYLKADNTFKANLHLVVNYAEPGSLIEADKAFYLHGGNVNSPMGGNLAAFNTSNNAEKFKATIGGDLLNWTDIKQIDF